MLKKLNLSLLCVQGIEDYLGDMDFKLAGTNKGITALQVLRFLQASKCIKLNVAVKNKRGLL